MWDTSSLGEITSQHPGRRIIRTAQFQCLSGVSGRVVRLALRYRVHEIAPDTILGRVLNDHCVTTGAAFRISVTVAIWVAARAANSGAHALDSGAGLLTDPHQKHGLNGSEVSLGLRVVAFGDALPVAAGEQIVTHDPAAAFAVGYFVGLPL